MHPGASLVDAASGDVLAGGGLAGAVGAFGRAYEDVAPGVVFAVTPLSLDGVLRYLGAVDAGRAVALLDPGLSRATVEALVERFTPVVVVGAEGAPPAGYAVSERPFAGSWVRRSETPPVVPHADLGVLLATSGSTGEAKFARLSWNAVLSNALSIGAALGLDRGEVAVTSLPLFYSYGLSVLNSHLAMGSRVVVADGGVLSRDFWSAVDAHGVTSLAGVPYSYEMLRKIRWSPERHASLRTLTQAGGRLRPDLIEHFAEASGGRLTVMYGQTEATARMTVLPPEKLAGKLGSVGPALPGGELLVRGEDGVLTGEAGVTGEVVYRGPNVMMGYAETAEDLARGDDLGGELATGDLGYLDEDGYLWITGRLKRIGKVFGVRVNLDDIERIAREAGVATGPIAAVADGDRVIVWAEGLAEEDAKALVSHVSSEVKLHRTGFQARPIEALPLLPSGKIDYRRLAELA